MSLLQVDQPLYLPEGSVRSILALSTVGAYLFGLITEPDLPLLVLGAYFADRISSK